MHVTSGLVSPASPLLPWRRQQPSCHRLADQHVHKNFHGADSCNGPTSVACSNRMQSSLLTAEGVRPAAASTHTSTPVHTQETFVQACERALEAPGGAQAAVQGSKLNNSSNRTGNSIISITAATPAAARSLCTSQDTSGDFAGQSHSTAHHDNECQAQDQQLQPAAAGVPEAASSRVWLPQKQLWVPRNCTHDSTAVGRTAAIAGSTPCEQLAPTARSGTLGRVYMAAAATRGHKRFMEDRHVVAALDPSHGVQQAQGAVGLQDKVSVAAVFDGHAGYATAAYAAQHIPQLLHEALSGRPGSSAEGGPRFPQRGLLAPATALAASFHWFDRWWADARCDPSFTQHGWDDSGSTAVVGMVCGQELVVANAGDSVALLASGGQSQRLTVEHRLDNAEEVERVLEAGGRVVSFKPGAVPRVMGTSSQTRFKGSMVTRSLGDFAFKHPQALISADPYVAAQQLTPADRLVVMTSDGVTDVLHDDDMLGVAIRAIEQAQQSTNNGQALAKAAANAVMSTALESGSRDNITVVTVLLDWDSEYSAD